MNGQKIYVTGGNYINSDWLLRLSPERYRDEVRFHAEMNLRMIRVWGGALVERPEFYNAMALGWTRPRWLPERGGGNIPIILIYLSPPWKIK